MKSVTELPFFGLFLFSVLDLLSKFENSRLLEAFINEVVVYSD